MAMDIETFLGLDERDLRERLNQIWRYVEEAEGRERAAQQRSDALVRVHEAGWRLVADAVTRGFERVAQAIRESR